MGSNALNRARDKMADAGVDPVAIDVFAHYFRLLEHGETGMIPESAIDPLDMESLADVDVPDDVATKALGSTAASAPRWAWTAPSRCSACAAACRSSTSSRGRCCSSARSTTCGCR